MNLFYTLSPEKKEIYTLKLSPIYPTHLKNHRKASQHKTLDSVQKCVISLSHSLAIAFKGHWVKSNISYVSH